MNEELGISGLNLQHRGQVEYRADVGNDLIEHELVDVFLAQASPDMPLNPNPAEVMATRWVTPKALVAEITTPLATLPHGYASIWLIMRI